MAGDATTTRAVATPHLLSGQLDEQSLAGTSTVLKVTSETAGSADDAPRLEIQTSHDRLTHYLFRYPAKFHPPVIRALLQRYSEAGGLVLDPFCGSGTLLVEAAVLNRRSLGLDLDPLAVAISNAKVQRVQETSLRKSAQRVLDVLSSHRRTPATYQRFQHEDLTDREYAYALNEVGTWVPAIPNLLHWFRRYVIIDLARIREAIQQTSMPSTHRRLLDIVFASIIRNASNADPVPVSGLEVTKWMKERDAAGRVVDPFALFESALTAAGKSAASFRRAAASGLAASARQRDATTLHLLHSVRADAVITSPPYHGAVDYYRRHQLEMFWLGLTSSQSDRLALLQRYIGRPYAPPRHPWVGERLVTGLAKDWEARIHEVSRDRAHAFRHYLVAMTKFFAGLSKHLMPGAPAVMVLGHSNWNGFEIPTTQLFSEISADYFELDEVLTYPVKNRYMSYARHNDADISQEYVLVLRRTTEHE